MLLKRHNQALEGYTTREGKFKRIESDILPPERLQAIEEIIRVTEPMRTMQKIEPSLTDLLTSYEQNYLPSEQKRLNG